MRELLYMTVLTRRMAKLVRWSHSQVTVWLGVSKLLSRQPESLQLPRGPAWSEQQSNLKHRLTRSRHYYLMYACTVSAAILNGHLIAWRKAMHQPRYKGQVPVCACTKTTPQQRPCMHAPSMYKGQKCLPGGSLYTCHNNYSFCA